MTDTVEALPRWDVATIFPSLGSREFAAAHEAMAADLGRLQALYDEHDVLGGAPRPPTDEDVTALEEIIRATNDLLAAMRVMSSYVYAHVTTDASDAEAAGAYSRFLADTAALAPLHKRLDAWVARLGADALVERSPLAAEHAFPLRRGAANAGHQMSEAEESLAAELALTGGWAWAKLHSDITAGLTAVVHRPGAEDPEQLPMSVVRGLATDRDAGVRRAAFEAEQTAWRTVQVPLAAAINAFKGEANTLNKRRGWADSLDPALLANSVDRAALEAMQAAVVTALPDFAAYHRAKARLLGHADGLPWWDMLAPVGTQGPVKWTAAVDAVHGAFGSYSPALARLVDRAVAERWIDAEPRAGKVGGAYCMSVEGDVSRVLLNFNGSFDSVQTLAHELGHAYHNIALGPRTPMQRRLPMALAETASIFCETIMVQARLAAAASGGERLALLDTDLGGATQVVVDIHSRYLFERAMTGEREKGVLAPERLSQLMLEAQRAAYLDGLDHDHLHPYMWAVKGHYFTAYYNWPYTFGLLFGIGLYAEYQRDPGRFRDGYDDLLSSTGLGDAAELAGRFGIDVHSVEFWTASLDVIRARITDFQAMSGF